MSGGLLLVAALLACLIRASQTESDVTKYPVPIVLNEEAHVFVLKGGDATLHCRTACDCKKSITPKITWLENGRRITPDDSTYTSSAGVLHVKNCSIGTNSRVFRCIAAVGNWSVVGIKRRIHVIDPSTPILSLKTVGHTQQVGGKALMRCNTIDKQINHMTNNGVVWFKDGKRLQFSRGGRYSSLPGGYIVIHSLTNADDGIYQCKYYLEAAKQYLSSKSVYLSIGSSTNVLSAPEFSYVSEDIEIAKGSPVSILCAAKGNPTPQIIIARDDHVSSSGVAVRGDGLANLTLQAVDTKDSGKYVCRVKSGGVILSRNVRLRVLSPPKFNLVPPRRKLTLNGIELSITCLASGIPEPLVIWYKNGKKIQESDKIKFNGLGKLTLRSPQSGDAGIYQCIATNKVGSSSHSTFVFLENSLRPPINVRARALSASSLNISWQLNPINNENAILAHVVFYEYNTSASKRLRKQKVIDEVSANSRIISQLFGGIPYSVYLSTYGQTGVKSGNSKTVRVRTLEGVPRISPHPVTAVNLGNKMICVNWTAIPLQYANGRIIRYKVEYGIAGYRMETTFVPAGKTQIVITRLSLGELYNIEVSAGTTAGFSNPAQTTIKIGDPDIADQKGPAMELRAINSTAVEVRWRLLKTNYITGFILTYVPIVTADYWHSVRITNLHPNLRSHTLTNLNPRKDYRIEIRIVSGPVQSKSSAIVHTTKKRAPLPSDLDSLKISNPRDLKCAVKDNTSIYLTWNAPIHTQDIDEYTVEIVLGGRTIETIRTFHTKELWYMLKNLSRGTWYYVRVNAIPKPQRINEISQKLKRKFKLPKYQSKLVPCMTDEARPGPPKNVRCNVTKNGHRAKASWYPPDYQHGLVVKYVVRYKHLVSDSRKTQWKTSYVTMKPNTKGYPLTYDLDVEYYRRYRIEVSAINGAGEGPASVVESCSLRRAVPGPTSVIGHDNTKKNDRLMADDTKLGIIVGCSIASLFILTFVIVFIWKNPFRLKSASSHRDDSSSKTSRAAIYNDEFLYLQRLAEIQSNIALGDYSARCSSSGRANGDNDAAGVSQPLMSKYHTAVELTGSSSGQPVCTCTCLLHGRLRGQVLNPQDRRNLAVEVAKDGEDTEDTNRLRNSACSSRNSEDVDSAESADSRTQILPKSLENTAHNSKDPSSAKVLQQIKKETTFQV